LNFFVATSTPRLLTRKLKDFALPSRRCSHRALFPWPPLPPSPGFGVPSRTACAVRHSTTRDHCDALKSLSRSISNRALNISLPCCQGFATRRQCLPCSPAQTPSLFVGDVIICAGPRCAFGRSDPALPLAKPDAPLRVRRSSRNGSTQTQSTARVNRFSIVWLAVCRKGIARSAALHLDCAPSAGKRSRINSC